MIISYFFYVIVFFVLPLYVAAVLQQTLHGVSEISLSVYLNSYFTAALRIGVWSVLFPAVLIVWIKNDLLTLITWGLIYLLVSFAYSFSDMYTTVNGNNIIQNIPFILFAVTNGLAVLSGIFLCRRLAEYKYGEKISGGVFSSIAGLLKLDLAKFHYRMLGLKTQNLFLIFGSLGFVLVLTLLKGMDANSVVISKIYVAVFFPLLFSFNQYDLIKIDTESGMADI